MNTKRSVPINLSPFSAMILLLGSCVVLTSLGCSGGPKKPADMPELTPCTITVTYKGEPVEGASVLLSPQSGKYSAAGTTDASGNAVMKTDGNYEGVVAGEFLATVTKLEKLDYVAPPEPEDFTKHMEWEEELKKQPVPKNLLPEKYASFGSSGLKVTVSAGSPAQETLELTD